jgi:hypothetical protein
MEQIISKKFSQIYKRYQCLDLRNTMVSGVGAVNEKKFTYGNTVTQLKNIKTKKRSLLGGEYGTLCAKLMQL